MLHCISSWIYLPQRNPGLENPTQRAFGGMDLGAARPALPMLSEVVVARNVYGEVRLSRPGLMPATNRWDRAVHLGSLIPRIRCIR